MGQSDRQMDSHKSLTCATVQEKLAWQIDPDSHQKIRRLWMKHSLAEDKRDLNGLISTLSPDCVYEVIHTGERWKGHDGGKIYFDRQELLSQLT